MQNLRAILIRQLNWALPLALIGSLALSACGFQLRGVADLSFKSIYIQGNAPSISKDLNKSLKTNGIQVVKTAKDAELLLEILGETYEKRILSLSGGGLAREFELNYQVKFRTREQTAPTWSTVQTVQTRRDFSYDDKALLGKAEEEAMLITDMRKDAVGEVLRRLTAIKLGAN